MRVKIAGLLVLVINLSFAQSVYYVSPSGNDSNSGTSPSSPWQTIQYSVSRLSPGDTLFVMAGEYNDQININVSGSNGNYIVIKAYGDGDAVLSGKTLSDYGYIMKIEGQRYIRIEGLKFFDYQAKDAIGIIVINSSYIQIIGCEFANIDYSSNAVGDRPSENDNSQPIIVFGRDPNQPSTHIEIRGNSIHDCEVGYSECISLNGNIDTFEVSYNTVYNNTNIGIVAIGFEGECSDPNYDQARNGRIHHNIVHDNPSAYDNCAGIYLDGAKNTVVEYNLLYNNNYGIEIGCENNGNINGATASNDTVRNNIIYNNTYTCIAIGGYDYPSNSGKVTNSLIRNNTCYNNDTKNNYQGELMISYTENSVIENNIFYTLNTDKVLYISDNSASNGITFDYNLYYTSAGDPNDIVIEWQGTEYNTFSDYQNGTGQDKNSLFTNPKFVSTSQPDLHLQTNSPAIDAGNPKTVISPNETDYDGDPRVSGQRIDIGSDEVQNPSFIIDAIEKNTQIYSPNPTSGTLFLNYTIFIKSVKIYTISGKIVKQFNGDFNKLDISELSSGIYIIKADTPEKILSQLIVKY